MDPISFCRDTCYGVFSRAFERRRTLILLLVLVLVGAICGMAFFKTPAFYEFHLRSCDRFLDRICYSDRNVFVLFLERTGGCVLLVALYLIGGVHIAGLFLPAAGILFRAYTFGGTVAVLFSVYRLPGALVVFVLYLPIRIMTDAVLLLAAALSVARAPAFCFSRSDFRDLLLDFAVLSLLIVLVCLIEAILLLALFHPLGNLL